MLFRTLVFVALLLLQSAISAPVVTTVFRPHDGLFPCYRQPALLTTNADRSHLIVFAEGRDVTSCAPPLDPKLNEKQRQVRDPNEIGALMMRRSTDSGRTWTNATKIYSGDIDFYTVVWDSHHNVVFLALQGMTSVLMFNSTDEGHTWSAPVRLTATPPAPLNKSVKPAVGHGIQIQPDLCGQTNCSDAGTLLMPFVCTNGTAHPSDKGACPSCNACVLRAAPTNGGSPRWSFGAVAQSYTRESQLVQTMSASGSSSHVYMTARNFSPTPGHRYWARSVDGASTFDQTGVDAALVEPVTPAWTGIVCSITRVSNNRIMFSGPANATLRADLVVRLSYDEAFTWPKSRVLFAGLAGYTDIATVGRNGDDVAIVFENGENTFADRISVAVFSVSWVEGAPS